MPWHVSKSKSCPESKPWAVVTDATGKTHGCHSDRKSAIKQMAVLYIKEKKGEIASITNEAMPAHLWQEAMALVLEGEDFEGF